MGGAVGVRLLEPVDHLTFCELSGVRTGAKSTVITTQLPIDHWPEVLEDPVIADSIVDRLKHVAISVTLMGESYRKIQGATRDKKLKN